MTAFTAHEVFKIGRFTDAPCTNIRTYVHTYIHSLHYIVLHYITLNYMYPLLCHKDSRIWNKA